MKHAGVFNFKDSLNYFFQLIFFKEILFFSVGKKQPNQTLPFAFFFVGNTAVEKYKLDQIIKFKNLERGIKRILPNQCISFPFLFVSARCRIQKKMANYFLKKPLQLSNNAIAAISPIFTAYLR